MTQPNLAKGIVLFLFSYFLLAVIGALVKSLSATVSTEVISFWQFLILWLGTLPMAWKAGGFKILESRHPDLIAVRVISGILAYFFFYHAVKQIPLIDSTLLLNAAPLYLPLIAYLWGHEHIDPKLWIGIIIGFVGIFVILRPTSGIFQVTALLGMLSGLLSGICMIAIRRFVQFDPPATLLFYYGLVGTLIFLPAAITDSGSHSDLIWIQLLLVGVCMLLMQYLLSLAFEYASAIVLGPLSYISVIFSGVFAWIFWGNTPDIWTLLGTFLVVFGAITTIWLSQRKSA